MKQKVERTEVATKIALERAGKKTEKQTQVIIKFDYIFNLVIHRQQRVAQPPGGITRIRKHFWFEKFNW